MVTQLPSLIHSLELTEAECLEALQVFDGWHRELGEPVPVQDKAMQVTLCNKCNDLIVLPRPKNKAHTLLPRTRNDLSLRLIDFLPNYELSRLLNCYLIPKSIFKANKKESYRT